ncbi:Ferritin-2 [Hibiscus syriacus]|uniref:Ferritin n=1 Tax=Hibiscus syriacus TaxID=106335 RepID=A0A6A2W7Y7_HIBSY|nr:ferritin-3, chloroplastic-like [Hibiscus syriacus]KAE8653703.1 Ferritin-2 [Hibiscus syriacus]
MLLRAAPAFSLSNHQVETQAPLFSNVSLSQTTFSRYFSSSSHQLYSPRNGTGSVVVCATKGANHKPLSGVVFEPCKEVKKELDLVPTLPQVSLARQKFTDDCEALINEQINVEYNVSYVYHSMFAYFDRDNVALKGLAKLFKELSLEEREHAEKFMKYQNKRGGKVKLQSILMPLSEFDHAEKADESYAMELALSLEKLTNEKLLDLYSVAVRNHDVQLTEFIQSEYLVEQVEAIKKISEYVAQLRRVGKGHGVWHFDQMLLHEGEEAAIA